MTNDQCPKLTTSLLLEAYVENAQRLAEENANLRKSIEGMERVAIIGDEMLRAKDKRIGSLLGSHREMQQQRNELQRQLRALRDIARIGMSVAVQDGGFDEVNKTFHELAHQAGDIKVDPTFLDELDISVVAGARMAQRRIRGEMSDQLKRNESMGMINALRVFMMTGGDDEGESERGASSGPPTPPRSGLI